jgi:tRNA G18 (ribose-2'-O)-methylase SpoU
MTRKTNPRGFFAIGVYHAKTPANIGTLMRSAYLYQAAFVFTVGHRYGHQASDTPNTRLHIPLFHFDTVDDLVKHLPYSTPLVGVELDPRGKKLHEYKHPERAVYLLGAEDHGLPQHVIDRCHALVEIETVEPQSMNVATAGSIIIYDRHIKQLVKRETLVGV